LDQKGYITTMRALFGKLSTEVLYDRTKGEQAFSDYIKQLEKCSVKLF
jgi:hypothetical protein